MHTPPGPDLAPSYIHLQSRCLTTKGMTSQRFIPKTSRNLWLLVPLNSILSLRYVIMLRMSIVRLGKGNQLLRIGALRIRSKPTAMMLRKR